MPKFFTIIISCLLIPLFTLELSCNVPPPKPSFRMIDPIVTLDNQGGLIVVYQTDENNRPNLFLQRLGSDGRKLWGERGIIINQDIEGTQILTPPVNIITTTDKTIIILWASKNVLYAQKLDLNGNLLWQEQGIKIANYVNRLYCETMPDPSGGVLLNWIDSDNYFYSQRIDSNGNLLWSCDQRLSRVMSFNTKPLNSGGYFLIWRSLEGGLFIQKVSLTGQFLWQDNISLIQPDFQFNAETQYKKMKYWLTVDSQNCCIAAWVSSIESNLLNIQKIANQGDMLWRRTISIPEDDLQKQFMIEDSRNGRFRIESNGSDGIFVFWLQGSLFKTTIGNPSEKTLWPELYLDQINSDGDILKRNNERPICSSVHMSYPDVPCYEVIINRSGTIEIIWNYVVITPGEKTQSYSLKKQIIDNSGNPLYDSDGILISNDFYLSLSNTGKQVLSDGENGLIFSFWGGQPNHTYLIKVDKNDQFTFGENGTCLDSWKN